MPTGYTAKLYDGKPVTFAEFVMDCARAMGANVMVRDEPAGGEKIPEEFEPSPWYQQQVDDDRRRLAELESMSDEEADMAARNDWHMEDGRRMERIQEMAAIRERYEAMLAAVEAWRPPTADHRGLKQFMIEQLMNSVNFDCDTDYYNKVPERLSGPQWRAKQIAGRKRTLVCNEEGAAKEIERTNSRNAWNRALRDSLKAAV